MKNYLMLASLAFISFIPSLLSAQSCDCQDYLYLNDVSTDEIHKFAVTSASGNITEIGSPWRAGDASITNSPHGTAVDINGFLYVGDVDNFSSTNPGSIDRYSCNGTLLTDNIPDINRWGYNIGLVDNTLYIPVTSLDIIELYDKCSGALLQTINTDFDLGWGFTISQDGTSYLYTTGWFTNETNKIVRGNLDGSGTETIVYQTATTTGAFMGVSDAPNGDIYAVLNEGDNGQGAASVLKLDANGNVLATSLIDNMLTQNAGVTSGYFGARGVAYSPAADHVYVGSLEDCIAAFDSDLIYQPSLSVGYVPGSEPKGLGIASECCLTAGQTVIDTTLCGNDLEDVFLQELIDCDGAICGTGWMETMANPNIDFDPCKAELSFTGEGGCAQFTLSSENTSQNAICTESFDVIVNVCFSTPPVLTATANCSYDPVSGDNAFTLDASLSSTAGLSGQMVNLLLDGAVIANATLDAAGNAAFSGLALGNQPGFGRVLSVEAVGDNFCSANAIALDLIACSPDCVNGSGTVGGNVFQDADNDGADAGAMEVGQSNIKVEVYDCDGNLVCDTWTNADGNWSCDGLTDGEEYRVEFSTPLQPHLQPSFAGTDNGTNTQFVTAPTCEVDYGVVDPAGYCQEDPDVVITCFVTGDPTDPDGPDDVVVVYPQSRSGVDVTDPAYVPPMVLKTKDEAGTVWGLAFDRNTRDVYTSAFLKRHNALVETDPVAGTPLNNPLGAIYRNNLAGGTTELFLDLSTVGIDVGMIADNATRGINIPFNQPSTDAPAFPLVGKIGLGDITFDEDNQQLLAINLNEKTLVTIDVQADGSPGAVTSTPIPDPGCQGGDFRPFAVEVHQGAVYLGVICDAATSNLRTDLSATVYRLDGGTSFSTLISFPLDYPKGYSTDDCIPESQWQPWRDTYPDESEACLVFTRGNGIERRYTYSQPILSNIDFDADGSLILSFMDRFTHQMGYRNGDLVDPPEALNFIVATTGDLLRVARLPDGTYQLENNATAGNLGPTAGAGNGEGPGGGEFYFGDFALNNSGGIPHSETGLGSAALNLANGVLVASTIRPGNNTLSSSAGTTNMSAADGTVLSGYTLFRGLNPAGVYGKGGGLGDIFLACDPLPIQIGNYVWIDEDEDGIQDACEPPLPGVMVKLYRKDGSNDPIQIATTETDANGNYYFSSTSATDPNLTWTGTGADTALVNGQEYFIAFCGDNAFNDTDNTIEVDGTTYCLTVANTGEGNNPDLNDSDATAQALGSLGTFPAYCTQPGETDTTSHTFDAGFKPTEVFDLALIKTLDLSTNPGPFSPGSTVDFTITVFNQGDIDATDIEVKDYVPSGLSLAPASAPTWTVSVDTAILTTPFSLAAGASEALSISFVIGTDFMLDTLVNRAEISNFDDDGDSATARPVDEDSTPNDNGADPAEADTPDEIDDDGDGTPGTMDDPADEDDYDWEGIPVQQSFDLNLVKRIDTIATPGPFTYGSTVTYAIEVRNQGSLDATDVEVADYIPEGLTLVADAIWQQDVDTARLVTPIALAAGDTARLSISFTIDLDFTGDEIINTAEISAAANALGLPDEDSRPGDNGNDAPELDTDDEDNDNGLNGNGNADRPDDEDDFDLARLSIETVSLGSTVFLDNNNDGLQNGADAGLPGIEVQLWDATTNMPVFTDANGVRVLDPADAAPYLTDANGDYHFTDLLPGDYFVVIPNAPASAPVSSNNTGNPFTETDPDDNQDSDDEGLQTGGTGAPVQSGVITLSLGDEPVDGAAAGAESDQGAMQDNSFDTNGNMTLDFGFFAPVSVGDVAFVDLDGDGLQIPGEPGIGGITVTLLDSDGNVVTTDAEGNPITGMTTTAADGSYLFDNLPPGEYAVIFDISTADNAEFYDFTVPKAGDDASDSDNTTLLSEDRAQSGLTPFLTSGQVGGDLDVGLICAVAVEVSEPFTICSTQPIDLTAGAVIEPTSLGGSWSVPGDADGTFLDAGGNPTTDLTFGNAVAYRPGSDDAARGEVTLILTSNEPDGPCMAVSAEVTIQILQVDCGQFFWNGN